MSYRLLLLCLLLCASPFLPAASGIAAAAENSPGVSAPATQPAPPLILGRWLTEPRDGIIEISLAADGSYQGKIIGGDSPHRTDAKNPDASKRSALLLGQTVMQQLRFKSPGRWSGGTIYDPDSGHTYSCYIDLLDADHLKVRGFIGLSLIGRTQVWTRYTGTNLVLPSSSMK